MPTALGIHLGPATALRSYQPKSICSSCSAAPRGLERTYEVTSEVRAAKPHTTGQNPPKLGSTSLQAVETDWVPTYTAPHLAEVQGSQRIDNQGSNAGARGGVRCQGWAPKDSKVARMTSAPRLCTSHKSSLTKQVSAGPGGHSDNQIAVEVYKEVMAQARSTC